MFGNQILFSIENWKVLHLNRTTQTKRSRVGKIWRAHKLAEKDVGITVNSKLSLSLSVMLLCKEPPLHYKYKQDNGVLPTLVL